MSRSNISGCYMCSQWLGGTRRIRQADLWCNGISRMCTHGLGGTGPLSSWHSRQYLWLHGPSGPLVAQEALAEQAFRASWLLHKKLKGLSDVTTPVPLLRDGWPFTDTDISGWSGVPLQQQCPRDSGKDSGRGGAHVLFPRTFTGGWPAAVVFARSPWRTSPRTSKLERRRIAGGRAALSGLVW